LPIVRVRQHVNPLCNKYLQPIDIPNWADVFADCSRPLLLDIGCARGNFVLEMAQQQPDWNFLGWEIREPLVEQANRLRDELGLRNLHYLFCNANFSVRELLESLPPDRLQTVTIQFPDPWFKKRHQKRRVVQPELVEALADFLPIGGEVFAQSDVADVAMDMGDRLDDCSRLCREQAGWEMANPFPVRTEREVGMIEKGGRVYRARWVRGVGV
jgi:tRNA (guanine-N7-)-methyltransferase